MYRPAARRQVWEALLDSDLVAMLRAGQSEAARQRANDIIDHAG